MFHPYALYKLMQIQLYALHKLIKIQLNHVWLPDSFSQANVNTTQLFMTAHVLFIYVPRA